MKNEFILLQRNRGFSLVVALLLLVALSLIGVAALRNVSLQEKMAGNTYFRMVTFQDAEAALSDSNQATGLSAYASEGFPRGVEGDKSTRLVLNEGGLPSFWTKSGAWTDTTVPTALSDKNKGTESNWIREDFKAFSSVEPCNDAKAQKFDQSDKCLTQVYRITSQSEMAATGAKAVTQNFYFIPDDKTITTVVP